MSNYDFESAPERAAARPAASAADRLAHTLAGFRLSESGRPARQRYPAPPLPPGFTPRHRARVSRFEPLPEERRGLERHRLSAGQRAEMIGEQRLPQPAGSDSPAGVQAGTQPGVPAIATETTAASTLPGRPGGPESTQSDTKPAGATPQSAQTSGAAAVKTEPGTAPPRTATTPGDAERLREVHKLLAEDGTESAGPAAPALKPFARDPEKQARYEQFLKLSAANRKGEKAVYK